MEKPSDTTCHPRGLQGHGRRHWILWEPVGAEPSSDTCQGGSRLNGADIIFRSIAAEVFCDVMRLYPWVAGHPGDPDHAVGRKAASVPRRRLQPRMRAPDSHFVPGMDLNNVAIVRARKRTATDAGAIMCQGRRASAFFRTACCRWRAGPTMPTGNETTRNFTPVLWRIELTTMPGSP